MPSLQDLRDHYGAYFLAMNPGYNWVRFQQLQIVPHLEAVERGEIQRLAIFMPPGHSKSDLATRNFVSWYLGRNPTHNAMVCSYSADLASDDFGAHIKARMESPLYRQIFPGSIPTRDSRSKAHFTNQSGGSFYSVGFQGGITGKRLNCFPAGTLVTTETGDIDIALLASMVNPPRVLGLDLDTGKLPWKIIQAGRKLYSNALVEITTNSGRRIRCTRDHKVYTTNGYRQAAVLRPGDRVLTLPIIEGDSVTIVRELCTDQVPVYDLQVEGTNNFFADGILVHNCMILDDLIKNKGDAESDTVQADLFETYKSTVKDRMRPGGAIVMCMHRWLTNDVAGRILEMDGTVDEGGAWTVLKLPAEDPPDSGHFLWEEYYGKKYYEDFKKDDETWASKFQQDPGSSLSYKFREDWLQFYDIPPPTNRFKSYIIVDPAASKSRTSDFTVVGVLCPAQEKKLILADWIWDRLDPGERTEAILRLCRKWTPEALYYESYGLNADSYYLKEKMAMDNFPQSAYPRVVGRSGPGHNNSKEIRIDSLIPFFREGKIVLPRKFERVRYDGTRIDYTENFIKYEYTPYRGRKSVPHDDNLDMLSRIADPDVHIDYDLPQDINQRKREYSRPIGSSWYALL